MEEVAIGHTHVRGP